jgi:hypothetical protein
MEIDTNTVVFLLVILGRLGLPLLIPRFPLPAIITCMLLDMVDQTIFQRFTTINLDGYQSYDKALDIYYLSIAYISTLRNWKNMYAFSASKFLLYYRLAGVMLFEMTGIRAILLIFPNTFEYFFIFYHAIALRWNPIKYTKRFIVGSIAFIWIFIKLPQEWWIHIAKLDVTETLNEYLFHMPPDTPMPEAFLSNMGITITIIAIVIAIILGIRWYVIHKLPPADVKPVFKLSAPDGKVVKENTKGLKTGNYMNNPLFEKIILIGLVGTIFSMMLPGDSTPVGMFLFVGAIIALNSFVSHWLSKRAAGVTVRGVAREFLAMATINALIVLAFIFLLPGVDGDINWKLVSFYLFLVTIFVTLYDRYFPVHQYLLLQQKHK